MNICFEFLFLEEEYITLLLHCSRYSEALVNGEKRPSGAERREKGKPDGVCYNL